MREVTSREQYALWRVRRLELEEKRLEFFRQEEEKLRAELLENPLPLQVEIWFLYCVQFVLFKSIFNSFGV